VASWRDHAARAPDFYLDRVTMAPPMRWRPVRAQRSVGDGVRAGRVCSLEMGTIGVPTCCGSAEGNIAGGVFASRR
jgi:hypothetical protein